MIPDKIFLNYPENTQVDETGLVSVNSTETIFRIGLGTKKTLNIQLYNNDGTEYDASDVAESLIICDNDYKNSSPFFPAGETGWTASGDEYYKALDNEPVSVYFDATQATKGTAGSLTAGQYDYDTETNILYVRLIGDLDPGEQVEAYISYKITVTGATNPFFSSSEFNLNSSWYDADTDSMVNPDLSSGQLTFSISANTVNFYERLEDSASKNCFAEIQLFDSSGDLIDIKTITVSCDNKLTTSESINLEIPDFIIKDSSLSGIGTSASPLGINLGNANTWTALQTFSGGIYLGSVFSKTVTVPDSTYDVLSSDYIIKANTDSNSITINLPAGVEDRTLIIKNIGSSENTVTLNPDGFEEIELNTLYDGDSFTIIYDTAKGWILL